MQQASETGVPAMRPLFLEFPEDEHAAELDDEFLFGSDLLVAPVMWEEATNRLVHLPKGDWHDYWTGRHHAGGSTIHVPVTLDTLPLFVRGGAFIYRQPVVQNTGEMPGKPLRVLIAPAAESESTFYEDDGETPAYRNGNFLKRRFHQVRDDRGITVEISAPEGNYRPAKRDLILEVWSDHEPKLVSADGRNGSLPHLKPAAFAESPHGWTYETGMIRVKEADDFKAVRFTIETGAKSMH